MYNRPRQLYLGNHHWRNLPWWTATLCVLVGFLLLWKTLWAKATSSLCSLFWTLREEILEAGTFKASVTFTHFIAKGPLSREFRVGMQCRNLKQGPERNAAYRLAPHGLRRLLSYATTCPMVAPGSIGQGLSHQSLGRKMPNRPASRQYDWGPFLSWAFSSQIILACAKLTTTPGSFVVECRWYLTANQDD